MHDQRESIEKESLDSTNEILKTSNLTKSKINSKLDPIEETTFQMQNSNTTYEVFDSYPKSSKNTDVSKEKNRTNVKNETKQVSKHTEPSTYLPNANDEKGVSKAEKEDYEKTKGVENTPEIIQQKDKNITVVSKAEKVTYETAIGDKIKPMPPKKIIPSKTPSKVEKQTYNASTGKHQQSKRKLFMNISLAEATEKMNPIEKIDSASEKKTTLKTNLTSEMIRQNSLSADQNSILGM